jgi:hypothetical protein
LSYFGHGLGGDQCGLDGDKLRLCFGVTLWAERNQVTQIVGLQIEVVLMTDIAKRAEWDNVVNIKSARLLLGLAAALAFVAISFPGGALLAIPIWPIVIGVTTFPVGIIFAYIRLMFRLPSCRTFHRTEVVSISSKASPSLLTKLFAAMVAYFGKFLDPSRVIFALVRSAKPCAVTFSGAKLEFLPICVILVSLKRCATFMAGNLCFTRCLPIAIAFYVAIESTCCAFLDLANRLLGRFAAVRARQNDPCAATGATTKALTVRFGFAFMDFKLFAAPRANYRNPLALRGGNAIGAAIVMFVFAEIVARALELFSTVVAGLCVLIHNPCVVAFSAAILWLHRRVAAKFNAALFASKHFSHKKHPLLAVDGTLAEGAPMPTGGVRSLPISMVFVNYDYTLSRCNYTIGRGV